jgi:dihydroxy-acid dehydratase
LEDGDVVEVDVPGRSLRVKLTDREIKRRLATLKPRKLKVVKGYLSRYSPVSAE